MNLAAWVGTHRRSLIFLFAALALAGLVLAFRMPVSLFPQVSFPRVVVSIDAGDRPAQQMLFQATIPAEEAIRRVPGVRNLRSRTSRGSAELSVNFDWGTDMASATLQVNSAIAQILPTLPAGTQTLTRRMDPTIFPILGFSLTSNNLSPAALRDLAQLQLRPLLSAVPGIARVGVLGGALEEYRVAVDPARLEALGLSVADVAAAVGAANVITAVGRIEDEYKLFLVVSDSRLDQLDRIRHAIIRSGANGVVELQDIADVTRSTVPQWIRVNADGKDAVLLMIYQQPDGNSVQIVQDVERTLAERRDKLPGDVRLAKWYDQSALVLASAASVRDAILVGAALAAVVLLVFLRKLRITLIALLVVPATLSTAVVLLYVLGQSFNIMTLGGLAAAVGLVIDDAMVMIEHIARRLARREPESPGDALSAAAEFSRPLAGSSAATLVVFLPLAFLGGVTGAFFKALALTMAVALGVSFLLAWLVVPVLAQSLLRRRDLEPPDARQRGQRILAGYARVLRPLLRQPWWLLVGIAPLLVAGVLAYRQVGSGFMPAIDEGGFVLDYRAAPGTSLSETDRLLRQVEELIRANPDVATYSRRTGTALGGGLTEANQGDFMIHLKPQPRAPIDTVIDGLREAIETRVPGLQVEFAQLMEDLIGDLTAVPQPIEIKLFGDDLAALQKVAGDAAAAIAKVKGVVDIRDGVNLAGDAVEIHVDRVKAALEGLDADAVTRELTGRLTGLVSTEVPVGPKMIGVRVWTRPDQRDRLAAIDAIRLRAPDGHPVPLRRVASIERKTGQPQLVRENFKQMFAVTGRISGRDIGSTVAEVRTMLDRPGALPAGVYYTLGGLYSEQQTAFRGLLWVFTAAVLLVFLLLLFLYERFAIAISILLMPLLSMAAVFIGLWATGVELNISSMMGMTMIVGIVTEVAIFFFSEYLDVCRHGETDAVEALIAAGSNRMRPIVMTTLAAILALLPLAFAWGEGAAMQQPLAVAIVSGLLIQLPMVLFVMPAVFRLLTKTGPRSARTPQERGGEAAPTLTQPDRGG